LIEWLVLQEHISKVYLSECEVWPLQRATGLGSVHSWWIWTHGRIIVSKF